MKIGKASYGGNKRNYYKMKEGEVVFRIIPPIGDLADDGIWSTYNNVHYGYKNSKGKMRVFQSPLVKNRKTKMVEVPDAALEKITALKTLLEKAKADKDATMTERLNKLVGPKGQYNLDSHHYMNVIDTQGNIGVLKIRHRAKLALDAAIKELRGKGVDPLSIDQGRFFRFKRSGMGLDTTFQVEVLQEKLNVPEVGEVYRDVVHKIDDTLIRRLGKEAAELDKLFQRPTAEEVSRIVKEGASAVDEILDTRETAEVDEGIEAGDDESTATATSTQGSSTPQATVQTQAVAPSQLTTLPNQQVASVVQTPVQAPSEPSRAPAAPAAQTLSSPPGTSTAQTIADMSESDFLKSLGLNQ